jgi:hypothetical protein
VTTRTLTIPARMPGLNELIESAAIHRLRYRSMKQKWGRTVSLLARAQGFSPITEPSHFEYEFGEPTRRRDPSNVAAGGIKILEDALQEAGLLPNDNWEWVLSFVATWKVSKDPYVKVTVRT